MGDKKKATATCILAAVMCLLAEQVQGGVVRICLPTPLQPAVSTACSDLLNSFSRTPGTTYECLGAADAAACTALVASGGAELTKLGGDSMFLANEQSKLQAFVAEVVSEDPSPAVRTATYFSIAVTTKATCDAIGPSISLASFKGRSACMTGYRKTAGWMLPMGSMIADGIIPVADAEPGVEADAESVANFFSRVCAAGVTPEGPVAGPAGGSKWAPLCSACARGSTCDAGTELYSDYPGSLRCLMEGSGDVAFMKHTTPLEYASDGTDPQDWSKVPKSDLRLVCKTGGCRPVEEWQDCYLGTAATHAFMGADNFEATPDGQAAIDFLSGVNRTFVSRAKTLGGAETQVLLTSSAVALTAVANPDSFATHFGTEAQSAFRALRNLQATTARICTESSSEQDFCGKVTSLMNSKALPVQFSCVQRANAEECLQAIRNNEADMRTFDGVEIYRGLKEYNLKAIVAEDYGAGSVTGTDYYAVAVVRRQFCEGGSPTFRDLQGKRMCATGYRRSAGWVMPAGLLVQSGVMPIKRDVSDVEDDAESVAAFFSGGVCAARTSDNGPRNTADKKGARWDPLCSACKGDCSSDINKEPYYDYPGAVRCLMEGAADVAFTKHSVAQDYAKDGKTPAAWSSLNQEDMRLLCPSGGCAPLSQAYRCHVATSAAHAVLVRADYRDSDKVKAAFTEISKDPEFRQLVFNGASNSGNWVFKAVTYQLVPVNDDTRTYLGSALAAFQGFDSFTSGGSTGLVPIPQAQQGSSSKKLSGGAIAGIAIGCTAAGALLAVAVVLLLNRRGQKRFDHLSASLNSSSPEPGKLDVKPVVPY